MRLYLTRYEGVIGADREEYEPWNIDMREHSHGLFVYTRTKPDQLACSVLYAYDVEGVKRPT